MADYNDLARQLISPLFPWIAERLGWGVSALPAPRPPSGPIFGIDCTQYGQAVSIANNGTSTVFGNARLFSGLFIVSEITVSGSVGLFLVDGGNAVVLVSQTATNYSTTAGTAAKTNVYLVSGAVTFENKLGATANYNILSLRTREL